MELLLVATLLPSLREENVLSIHEDWLCAGHANARLHLRCVIAMTSLYDLSTLLLPLIMAKGPATAKRTGFFVNRPPKVRVRQRAREQMQMLTMTTNEHHHKHH